MKEGSDIGICNPGVTGEVGGEGSKKRMDTIYFLMPLNPVIMWPPHV